METGVSSAVPPQPDPKPPLEAQLSPVNSCRSPEVVELQTSVPRHVIARPRLSATAAQSGDDPSPDLLFPNMDCDVFVSLATPEALADILLYDLSAFESAATPDMPACYVNHPSSLTHRGDTLTPLLLD